MTPKQKEKILKVITTSQYGVIATNSPSGTPESALVAISNTPNLDIIIGSFKESRKNQNITKNPNVSIVIGWENSTTLQIEGIAKIVRGKEREQLEEIHCHKNKKSIKYRKDLRQEYIKIKPRWIRYSNFSIDPQEVWEVNL